MPRDLHEHLQRLEVVADTELREERRDNDRGQGRRGAGAKQPRQRGEHVATGHLQQPGMSSRELFGVWMGLGWSDLGPAGAGGLGDDGGDGGEHSPRPGADAAALPDPLRKAEQPRDA